MIVNALIRKEPISSYYLKHMGLVIIHLSDSNRGFERTLYEARDDDETTGLFSRG